jgi:hypothetical protein
MVTHFTTAPGLSFAACVEHISWSTPVVALRDPQEEAWHDRISSPSGHRWRGGVNAAGGCGGRNIGGQFGGLRPQLGAQRLDR